MSTKIHGASDGLTSVIGGSATMPKSVYAWHWLQKNRRFRFRDGQPCDDGGLVEPGKTYSAEGEIALCKNGMHGALRILDGLKYAYGPILCRVKLEGDIVWGVDKLAARHRTVLWMVDASDTLHEFALTLAERLIRDARPDVIEVMSEALEAKRRWLETPNSLTEENLVSAGVRLLAFAKHTGVVPWPVVYTVYGALFKQPWWALLETSQSYALAVATSDGGTPGDITDQLERELEHLIRAKAWWQVDPNTGEEICLAGLPTGTGV